MCLFTWTLTCSIRKSRRIPIQCTVRCCTTKVKLGTLIPEWSFWALCYLAELRVTLCLTTVAKREGPLTFKAMLKATNSSSNPVSMHACTSLCGQCSQQVYFRAHTVKICFLACVDRFICSLWIHYLFSEIPWIFLKSLETLLLCLLHHWSFAPELLY